MTERHIEDIVDMISLLLVSEGLSLSGKAVNTASLLINKV